MLKEIIVVQVGNMYTRAPFINDPNQKELTETIREAIYYRDKRPSDFFPPRYSMKRARKDAKKYGGVITRITLSYEPYTEAHRE